MVPAIAFGSVARLVSLKPAHAQPPFALHHMAAPARPRPSGRPIWALGGRSADSSPALPT